MQWAAIISSKICICAVIIPFVNKRNSINTTMLAAEKIEKKLAAAFLKEKFLNHEVFDQLLYIYGTRQRKKEELGLRPQKLHLYGGNLKGLEKLHLQSMGD
jgi:hypothetical protein